MVICLFIYFLMFLLTSYLTESLWWRCQPRRLSQGWRRKWREGEDKGAARGGAHPQSEGSPGAGNQCHWPSLRAAGHSHSRLRLRGRGNCIPDGPTSGGKGTCRNVLRIVPSKNWWHLFWHTFIHGELCCHDALWKYTADKRKSFERY